MAYEMKDGEFQITKGSGEGKPIATIKAKVDGKEHDIAFWRKSFNWGTVVSGNLGQIKSVYCAFLKFTVAAVAYYWRQEIVKQQQKSENKTERPTNSLPTNPNVEDTGI